MEDMTIFNLREVNKGALKATVSIRLGNGLLPCPESLIAEVM
jgi:hypothetical protein